MFTKAGIEKYFNAEKAESLLFLGIGIAAVITALVFFFYLKTNFYKGAALPLAVLGLLLTVVGYTVYARSDGDRIRNVYAYDMNPGELKEKEIPRMETVMKSFVVYRYTEIALALIGIGLFIFFYKTDGCFAGSMIPFWKGFGLTLAIMSLLALGADYFAEKRGHEYINGLRSFVNKK
ncbi:MAG: hypothetical protein K2X48_11210 [Chitinophagaceae bacterium]|nr:hypothetical protein [Chitinophagaceae bacterium]